MYVCWVIFRESQLSLVLIRSSMYYQGIYFTFLSDWFCREILMLNNIVILNWNRLQEITAKSYLKCVLKWVRIHCRISRSSFSDRPTERYNLKIFITIFLLISTPATFKPYINLLYDNPFILAAALILAIHNCLNCLFFCFLPL